MAVDEPQPRALQPAPKREAHAEQKRAVAANYERPAPRRHHAIDAVPQLVARGEQSRQSEHAGRAVALGGTHARRDVTLVLGAQTLQQSGAPQRCRRELLAPWSRG